MSDFFGLHLPIQSVGGMTAVLILSVIIGALIGFEREAHGHPAGIRTHILVCLGSTLISLISSNMGKGGGDRIAAQIVSGVGFLGAGAIIRDGATVRGLTTAASIWVTAAIGIALGTSPWFGSIGLIAAGIVLFTLWGLNRTEKWADRISGRPINIEVTVSDRPGVVVALRKSVEEMNARIISVAVEPGTVKGAKLVTLKVSPNWKQENMSLVENIADLPDILGVRLEA